MEEVILSGVSNEMLLDMYWDYKNSVYRYQNKLNGNLDKVEREHYNEVFIYTKEYFEQIKLECLRRMYGMNID